MQLSDTFDVAPSVPPGSLDLQTLSNEEGCAGHLHSTVREEGGAGRCGSSSRCSGRRKTGPVLVSQHEKRGAFRTSAPFRDCKYNLKVAILE